MFDQFLNYYKNKNKNKNKTKKNKKDERKIKLKENIDKIKKRRKGYGRSKKIPSIWPFPAAKWSGVCSTLFMQFTSAPAKNIRRERREEGGERYREWDGGRERKRRERGEREERERRERGEREERERRE
jgi:hypothetical protein